MTFSRANQLRAYRNAADALDAAGVRWWLLCGTLLGHVREGEFLQVRSEKDVDLGVWATDRHKARRALAAVAEITHSGSRKVQAKPYGVLVDIHLHRRNRDHVWYELRRRRTNRRLVHVFPARLFEEMDAVEFAGRATLAPSPAEDYLALEYGPNWSTPDPSWQHWRNTPCLSDREPS